MQLSQRFYFGGPSPTWGNSGKESSELVKQKPKVVNGGRDGNGGEYNYVKLDHKQLVPFITKVSLLEQTTPVGMQAGIFGACPQPGENERVASGRASGVKMGMGGSLISPDGVAPSRMVDVSASVIFHHKSPEEDFFCHQPTWVVPEKRP